MEYALAGIIIYLCGVTTGYLLPRATKTIITETPYIPQSKPAMIYDPISRKPRKIA